MGAKACQLGLRSALATGGVGGLVGGWAAGWNRARKKRKRGGDADSDSKLTVNERAGDADDGGECGGLRLGAKTVTRCVWGQKP